MISLGWEQYKALAPLFDKGSPVHIETLEDYPGNIVDLGVIFFVNEGDQDLRFLTAEGELLTREEWKGQIDGLLDLFTMLKGNN